MSFCCCRGSVLVVVFFVVAGEGCCRCCCCRCCCCRCCRCCWYKIYVHSIVVLSDFSFWLFPFSFDRCSIFVCSTDLESPRKIRWLLPSCFTKRRKVMRAKSSKLSCQTKLRNAKRSLMDPIEETLLDASNSNKSKSNKSLHEFSIGMLQPKVP